MVLYKSFYKKLLNTDRLSLSTVVMTKIFTKCESTGAGRRCPRIARHRGDGAI